ncbi:hypothetical protein COU57_02545 [Candidatus Pacearchaeota archaeon CG10_big_fil_rev_8_21_14_0_10_32_14]|nr:MAG: hypothetical protein COU57_02545 [Candidatus Pacearchaeota archaeon CG10_big_fil_rev_8_21_14_0_10_32_14]
MLISIENIIKPENPLEYEISRNEDFIKGCYWGVPRSGHDEGKVIYHIRDVLRNVEKYSSSQTRVDLRLIAMIHDTFKYKQTRPILPSRENHHAVIARRFAEQFITNPQILEIIELHDEAYNSWQNIEFKGNHQKAEERAKKLIDRLGNNLDLYLTFYKCDNKTSSKSPVNYNWFSLLAQNVLASRNNDFSNQNPLPLHTFIS